MEVMVDIETLGNGATPAIVSIGAAKFSLTGEGHSETFYANIHFDDALKYGDATGSALMWWFVQSEEAQRALTRNPRPLNRALMDFRTFYANANSLWSHATFDSVALAHAYRGIDMNQPWHYRDVRDIRTLTHVWRSLTNGMLAQVMQDQTGTPHNALDDAIFQVKYVQTMWKELKNG